jgi:membrane-associated phospholipid phosphatase
MTRINSYLIAGIIMLAISSSICISQTAQDSSKIIPRNSFISTVAGDISYVASSPFHLSKTEALEFFSFIALNTALVYKADAPIDEELAVEGYHGYLKPAERLADLGYTYDRIGPAPILASITGTMLATGIIFKNRKLLETARLVVESALITGFITHLSKDLFNRSRPYTDRGATDFHLFRFSNAHEFTSFPSGHASNIFSLVTVITKQYPAWWLKVPAYTLAVSVALQRIDDRQHWTSDVVVGGLLGYWVGSRLVNRYQNKSKRISICTYLSGNQIGVRFLF